MERRDVRRTTLSRREQLEMLISLLTPNIERDLVDFEAGVDMFEVKKEGRATRGVMFAPAFGMLEAAERELAELTAAEQPA